MRCYDVRRERQEKKYGEYATLVTNELAIEESYEKSKKSYYREIKRQNNEHKADIQSLEKE